MSCSTYYQTRVDNVYRSRHSIDDDKSLLHWLLRRRHLNLVNSNRSICCLTDRRRTNRSNARIQDDNAAEAALSCKDSC
jgi:hypothetical protein